MLQQFSWPQFLLVIGVLSLLWYLVVVLVFYRKELKVFFGGKGMGARLDFQLGKQQRSLSHRWEDGVERLVPGAVAEPVVLNPFENELMGRSRLPEGMSTVSVEELGFVSGSEGLADRDVEDQQGLVPDVLQDLKEVFGMLAKEDGSKQDFFRLMETVRLSYPGLSAHPALRRINRFIADHASFHLSADELENLWN